MFHPSFNPSVIFVVIEDPSRSFLSVHWPLLDIFSLLGSIEWVRSCFLLPILFQFPWHIQPTILQPPVSFNQNDLHIINRCKGRFFFNYKRRTDPELLELGSNNTKLSHLFISLLSILIDHPRQTPVDGREELHSNKRFPYVRLCKFWSIDVIMTRTSVRSRTQT